MEDKCRGKYMTFNVKSMQGWGWGGTGSKGECSLPPCLLPPKKETLLLGHLISKGAV